MRYQPIENYGVVGNLRTVALVGLDGSIDWMCVPSFDAPSVFGAILDHAKGGRFRVAPDVTGARAKQLYWPETNVLVTRFLHEDGVVELVDYMPIGADAGGDLLVRQVRVVRGRLPVRMECRPAFDYARGECEVRVEGSSARFEGHAAGAPLHLALASSVPLRRHGGGVFAEATLGVGESAAFVLRVARAGEPCDPRCPSEGELAARLDATIEHWRRWSARCTYRGRWREEVLRSALVLKLLTYEPTGAIVAAATTSLPESIGGSRNWDYRYTWIRDASFTVYALLRLGFTEEAARFMDWLRGRWREETKRTDGVDGASPLQVMYRVDGSAELPEEELRHLDGYMGSRPVRIGNAAHAQRQLDIYGELMDAVYLFNKHASPIGYDAWRHLRGVLDWVSLHWNEPDDGLWEVRGGARDFVYSRMMCWVALDRGLRLADKRSFPANRAQWLAARDAVYEEVMERGWSAERHAFVQAYGSTALDASALLMPLVFFVAPNDPRMLATIDAIRSPTEKGGLGADGLVHRYNPKAAPDGLPGTEGTFNMCSFWLVEALTRAGRTEPCRLLEARLLFERMLGYANHLGLYAEQTGPSGQALGNFPQAFTHLALISAAFNLDRALGERR